VQILAGDTEAPGTSAAPFQSWYGSNSGKIVAGKTGTSVAVVGGKETSQNAALWFVGMTPNLVATSALINLDHPNAPATGLPGVTNAAANAYGAYASGVWLSALGPYLGGVPGWTWTPPGAIPGTPVPVLTNLSLDQAKQRLSAAGFRMAQFASGSVQCSSRVPGQQVAFYAPQIAPPGSTITVCLSSGIPLLTAPQPRPATSPRPGGASGGSTTQAGNGNGNGRPGGGRTVTVTVPPGNH
jgi:membrane peptidoglycan carboxypeptidase